MNNTKHELEGRLIGRQLARPLTEAELNAVAGGMRPASWCEYQGNENRDDCV